MSLIVVAIIGALPIVTGALRLIYIWMLRRQRCATATRLTACMRDIGFWRNTATLTESPIERDVARRYLLDVHGVDLDAEEVRDRRVASERIDRYTAGCRCNACVATHREAQRTPTTQYSLSKYPYLESHRRPRR